MADVPSAPGSLDGRVAVVTAAASGIGRATALRLARDGAHVHAIDINPAVAQTTDSIRASGGSGEPRVLDCLDRERVEAEFAKIGSASGKVDILVNAVGQPVRGDDYREFWCSEPESWQFVLDICLKTMMLCSRQVVPGMRERRYGKIVNISSVSWLMPPKTFSEYAAAKAGVVGFTRVLATELAPFGVNVNAVSPGPIRSIQSDAQPQEFRDRILSTVPLGRFGQPDDIASGIAYLVRDEASFVTGHNLVISGGRAML